MARLLTTITLAVLALAPPAQAVLAYEGPTTGGKQAPIIAARNDGSDTRVIGRGTTPRVSPSGHKVAYFSATSNGEVLMVVGNRGRRRHLLARPSHESGVFVPIAWGADDRHLIAGRGDPGGAWLVDVFHLTKTKIHLGGSFVGASFDPSGSRFAVAGIPEGGDPSLRVVSLKTMKGHRIDKGAYPVWGPRGLAYLRNDRLLLRRHLGDDPETLVRGLPYPLDWSADGKRLLAYQFAHFREDRRALLIDLSPRRITPVKHLFPAQLSRDGTEILGQHGGRYGAADGDVVVRRADGTLKVLATNATRPSWSK